MSNNNCLELYHHHYQQQQQQHYDAAAHNDDDAAAECGASRAEKCLRAAEIKNKKHKKKTQKIHRKVIKENKSRERAGKAGDKGLALQRVGAYEGERGCGGKGLQFKVTMAQDRGITYADSADCHAVLIV